LTESAPAVETRLMVTLPPEKIDVASHSWHIGRLRRGMSLTFVRRLREDPCR